ncbi:MAG: helix-turn-helix domain-containing protein [Lachnospiraceae bacterium]|nr:helix-turn-helix domain-containing protein [Lachnospiraceae bacterium]
MNNVTSPPDSEGIPIISPNWLTDFPDMMTTAEVCRLLRLSRPAVYDLIVRGNLIAVSIGRKYLFPKQAVIELITKCTKHP